MGFGAKTFEKIAAMISGGTGGETNEDKIKAMRNVNGIKSGGKVSSASKRADGCATKGKTRGKMV